MTNTATIEWTQEEEEFFQELTSQRRVAADLLQVAHTLRDTAARISARGVPPGFALAQCPHTDAVTGTAGVQTVVFIPNNT